MCEVVEIPLQIFRLFEACRCRRLPSSEFKDCRSSQSVLVWPPFLQILNESEILPTRGVANQGRIVGSPGLILYGYRALAHRTDHACICPQTLILKFTHLIGSDFMGDSARNCDTMD